MNNHSQLIIKNLAHRLTKGYCDFTHKYALKHHPIGTASLQHMKQDTHLL